MADLTELSIEELEDELSDKALWIAEAVANVKRLYAERDKIEEEMLRRGV